MTSGLDWATLFGDVKTSVMSAITAIVPIGLGIFGVIYAVRKGMQALRASGGR